MFWKEASFIYLDGLKYHEKRIVYEEFYKDIEIQSVSNIQYSAENIEGPLLRSMKKDIGYRLRQVFRDQPFHIERSIYEKSNDTREFIIVGENHLVVKKGSFCDEKILRAFQNYYRYHLTRLSEYDIVKNEMYYPLIEAYQAMMDGKIDPEVLTKACFTIPPDIYLELLQVFQGIAGLNPSWLDFEKGKEKLKVLLEYKK